MGLNSLINFGQTGEIINQKFRKFGKDILQAFYEPTQQDKYEVYSFLLQNPQTWINIQDIKDILKNDNINNILIDITNAGILKNNGNNEIFLTPNGEKKLKFYLEQAKKDRLFLVQKNFSKRKLRKQSDN